MHNNEQEQLDALVQQIESVAVDSDDAASVTSSAFAQQLASVELGSDAGGSETYSGRSHPQAAPESVADSVVESLAESLVESVDEEPQPRHIEEPAPQHTKEARPLHTTEPLPQHATEPPPPHTEEARLRLELQAAWEERQQLRGAAFALAQQLSAVLQRTHEASSVAPPLARRLSAAASASEAAVADPTQVMQRNLEAVTAAYSEAVDDMHGLVGDVKKLVSPVRALLALLVEQGPTADVGVTRGCSSAAAAAPAAATSRRSARHDTSWSTACGEVARLAASLHAQRVLHEGEAFLCECVARAAREADDAQAEPAEAAMVSLAAMLRALATLQELNPADGGCGSVEVEDSLTMAERALEEAAARCRAALGQEHRGTCGLLNALAALRLLGAERADRALEDVAVSSRQQLVRDADEGCAAALADLASHWYGVLCRERHRPPL